MIHYIPDSGPQECSYSIENPWNQSLGMLRDYLHPYRVKPYSYRSIKSGRLVSHLLIGIQSHWHILHETHQYAKLSREQKWGIRVFSYLRPCLSIGYPTVSLIHNIESWRKNYCHWFLDLLPRAVAALDYASKSGATVKALVPDPMKDWQRDSLMLLGWNQKDMIAIKNLNRHTVISTQTLLACPGARGSYSITGPKDVLLPSMAAQVSSCLLRGVERLKSTYGRDSHRVYITRKSASSRRVLNEDALRPLLAQYNFKIIELEALNLIQQIQLFRSATHVIAVHGAGLTNLLYARNANVLEIFADGHFIRPTFFQIASALGNHYYHYVEKSENAWNDITLDKSAIESFMAITTK